VLLDMPHRHSHWENERERSTQSSHCWIVRTKQAIVAKQRLERWRRETEALRNGGLSMREVARHWLRSRVGVR